jgi:energy-coupling factor transporter ATP-binding protein EcfA2
MHIQRITLTDVRQFRQATFQFQSGFNLLVGENGAGKTTLLRSIATALRTKRVGRKLALTDDDIRLYSQGLSVEVDTVDAQQHIYKFRYDKRLNKRAKHSGPGKEINVIVYASNESTCGSFKERRSKSYGGQGREPFRSAEEGLYDLEHGVDLDIQPELKFGRSQAIRTFVLRILSRFSADFRDFGWSFEPVTCRILPPRETANQPSDFPSAKKITERIIMRHLAEASKMRNRWPDQRRVVLNASGYEIDRERKGAPLIPKLSDLMFRTDTSKTSIDYLQSCFVEIRLQPRIVILSRTGKLLLQQLSDGQKRLFSIFADIARRLTLERANGPIDSASAIVLIDEIDVHLHPNWQRRIVPALEELFRGCQFIATTHSPFVIQAVDRDRILNAEPIKQHRIKPGPNSIEDIIEDVQGVEMPQRGERAERLSKAAQIYFSLLRRKRVDSVIIANAEREYRLASEPFTSNPAIHALLKVEQLEARNQ